MKKLKSNWLCVLTLSLLIVLVFSCDDNNTDYPPFSPTAVLTAEPNPSNGLEISFNAKVTNAESILWDFGDGTTSIEPNPTHTYTTEGDYTVILTVTGEEGTTPFVLTESVTAVTSFDSGLINYSAWTEQVAGGSGVDITISEEDYTINFAGPGAWNGSHIFQEVTVEPGTYKLSGKLIVNSVIDEVWCELSFSTIMPQTGVDYNPGPQGHEVAYSTWNGSPKDPGTYALKDFNKGGALPVDGLYTYDTAETFYIVIKSGSGQPYDITYEELSFRKVE